MREREAVNDGCAVRSLRNMSKRSASVSSGVPDTEKQMKAQGRRPSAFIVSSF